MVDILWRMLFYITCLPLCYSCYLSRSIRRKKHEVLRETLAPTLESGVEKALFQHVSSTKCHKPPVGDESTKPHNEIEVNVIILQSATSRVLQRHLYEDTKESTRKLSIPQPLLRRSASTQPNLEVVVEDVDGNDGSSQLRRGVTVHPSASRPIATRRWSQIGTLGSTVARLSRRKKASAPARVVEEQAEGIDVVDNVDAEGDGDHFEDALSTLNGCDEKVALRKPKR